MMPDVRLEIAIAQYKHIYSEKKKIGWSGTIEERFERYIANLELNKLQIEIKILSKLVGIDTQFNAMTDEIE